MTPSNFVEGLARARHDVDRVCELLVAAAPACLEASPAFLQHACSRLAELRSGLSSVSGHAAVIDEAHRLQAAVRRATTLLESGLAYHERWNLLLGAMSAGYTVQGAAAPAARPGLVCVTG